MLESKFKRGIFIPVFAAVFLFVLLICIVLFFTGQGNDPMFALITVPVSIIFLIWIVRGELRLKAVKVEISNDRIRIRRYLGYGALEEYWFSEMDGYKTVLLQSEYRDYESLSILKNGRKIVRVSEFYHENYFELKDMISAKCKRLK